MNLLIRYKGFTKEWVAEHTKYIKIRINAKALLHIFEDVYIVSSAPNYFINQFAKEHGIPEDRMISSEYKFDDDGLICECSRPVSDGDKADFVDRVSGQFDILIGVGDSYEQDAGFLTNCDIRILMNEYRSGYLSVRELAPVKSFLENLKKCVLFSGYSSVDSAKFVDVSKASQKLLEEYSYDNNVFIMTPYRDDSSYKLMIRVIIDELKKCEFEGWIASDKDVHEDLWADTQAFMLACKYGIAVFTEEQESNSTQPTKKQRGDSKQSKKKVYNPNVAIELGFMLSRGKEVLILKDKNLDTLPTDMMGKLYGNFDLEHTEETLPPIIKKWFDERIEKK